MLISNSLDDTTDILGTLEALLQRVNPGGVCAAWVDVPGLLPRLLFDTAQMLAIEDVAEAVPCPAPVAPEAIYDRCLGPLCAELRVWQLTSYLQLAGEEGLWQHVCDTVALCCSKREHGRSVHQPCQR